MLKNIVPRIMVSIRHFWIIFTAALVVSGQKLLFEPLQSNPTPCCTTDKLFEVTKMYSGAKMKAGNADVIQVTFANQIFSNHSDETEQFRHKLSRRSKPLHEYS